MQILFKSFQWSSCGQGGQAVSPPCVRGTLLGMVGIEKGKVNEPEVSAAWVGCGGAEEGCVLFYWSPALAGRVERGGGPGLAEFVGKVMQ